MIYISDKAKDAKFFFDETGALTVNVVIGKTHLRLSPDAAVALSRSLRNVGEYIVSAIGDEGFSKIKRFPE